MLKIIDSSNPLDAGKMREFAAFFIKWMAADPAIYPPMDRTVCIDLETSGLNPHSRQILITGMKFGTGEAYAFYGCPSEVSSAIAIIMDNSGYTICGHNLKFDFKFLMAADKRVENAFKSIRCNIVDTMIIEQALSLGKDQSNSLAAVAKRYLDMDMDKDIREEFIDMDIKDLKMRHFKYLEKDLTAPLEILKHQREVVGNMKLTQKMKIELAAIKVFTMMEYYGSNFDPDAWKLNVLQNERKLKVVTNFMDNALKNALQVCNVDPKREYRYKAKRHNQDVVQVGLFGGEKKVHTVSKIKVNYASPKQVVEIFEDFKQPVPEDKYGKPSVGKEPLAKYGLIYPDSPLNEFIKHYREYVQVKKRISSFGDNIIDMMVDNRIHSAYRQLGTATGRPASGDTRNGFPNMNQIPRDNTYRTPFIADPGYVYMTIDYSSCELVILAAQSGDKTMQKLLSDPDLDLHSYLANAAWSKVKGKPYEVSHEERQVFKAVNFGLVYGASVFRIADILNISVDDAELVMKALRETIPDAFAYLDKVGDEAVRNGNVKFNDVTNARRWFPEVFTARETHRYLDRGEVGSVKRKAMNAPIQGTNADITKAAMVEVDKYLTEHIVPDYPKTHIVMQVYDEIVIQIPEGVQIAGRIQEIMEDTANDFLVASGSDLKMGSDYKIEKSWIK